MPIPARVNLQTAMSPTESEDPLRGTRYRAVDRLGMGTMGEVFLVEHLALGRRFVAKVLHSRHSQSDEYVARLRREARTLGQIRHPNIVAVTDFDLTQSGRPFIVMEYLDGHTLADELKTRRQLPESEVLTYTRQILSALAAAHVNGVVHRDVKPQNLFLHSRAGASPGIKVLDFGAARDTQGFAAQSPDEPRATSTGTVVGTLGYLSPEGADGRRVDPRADLYAVGLVLTVMLSGNLPTPQSVQSSFVESDLLLPKRLRSAIAPVILKALAFDPDRRFQRAEEFLDALPAP